MAPLLLQICLHRILLFLMRGYITPGQIRS